MTGGEEFNAAANIMIPVENPESSQNIADIQNDEKMAHMAQELEILREELRQVRDLAKLSATTFPSFKMPSYLPRADLPPTDSPNMPKRAPAHGQAPLAHPSAIRTAPDLPTQDPVTPTYPVTNQIFGAHTVAPYDSHIPPVYAVEAPTFTIPVRVKVSHEVDQYAEMEKDARLKEDESIDAQLRGLRKALKNLQVSRGTESLDYDDLCIHPDIDMPVGYKPPKFDIFDGKSDPHTHLRAYCDKLVGVGRNEKLRMKLFIRSLSGEALTWYTRQDPRKWYNWQEMAEDFMNCFRFNTEITADRFSLANIQKKPSEDFQEYARRWRTEAARVQPPLDESELSKYFIRAQEGIYFDKMMSMMGQKFAELVKMGDFIEEGIKSGKIQSMAALQAASKAIQSGSIGGIKKKREDVSVVNYQHGGQSHQYPNNPQIVAHTPYTSYPVYNTRPHYNPPRAPTYQSPTRPHVPLQAPTHQNRPAYVPRPRPNLEARNTRTYTPIAEPYAQLFERLRIAGVLQPVEGKLPDPIPYNFDGNKRCAYHSGIQGHDTEDCYGLKNQVETLIRRGIIKCTPTPPNVNNNPLPNHENREVNMISLEEEYNLGETITPVWNAEEAATASPVQPIITVQLKEPLTVQTYLPRVVVTTTVARKAEFDTKEVPWDYKTKAKGKMIDTAVAQGMTRSGRCYTPENLDQGVIGKEPNPKKNVTDAEVTEFWRKMQPKDYSVEEQLKKTSAHISIMSLLMSSEAHRNALMEVLNGVCIPKETASETLAATIGQVLESNKISFHDNELPTEGTGHNKALHIAVKCRDKIVTRVLIDGGSGCNICLFTTMRVLGLNMGDIEESRVKVRAFDGAQRSVIGEIHLTLQVGPAEFPILFQVMDVSSNYNLLLGRPWVHMAKAVPSTLHQCVKFEWGHTEVTVHGELNHPIYSVNSVPVNEELDGATFHTLEIMQAVRIDEKLESVGVKLSGASKMVAAEMLKYGYQPKTGLGPRANGIVEPIQLKHQKGTTGLGYGSTSGRVHNRGSIKITFVPEQVPILDHASDDDIVEGIGNLFVAMIGEEEEIDLRKLSIRDSKPGESLQNWTVSPSLFRQKSW
ncbi:uncharacterized protein LOC129869872 [Solanum dulcamara]|uniref:uncharacterized protein LOC129869872 n=1 Tax=Solanum dulcamara TaxID=45834 RepID=UPI002485D413|nr:uncharacterized protein LOC129869872 [Solanum dulcamara]